MSPIGSEPCVPRLPLSGQVKLLDEFQAAGRLGCNIYNIT